MKELPTTVKAYLDDLQVELRGADPAAIQDAISDVEEYLNNELTAGSGKSEAEIVKQFAAGFGDIASVADCYVPTRKMSLATQFRETSAHGFRIGKYLLSALWDPFTYGGLFFMFSALPTGVIFFSWVVFMAVLCVVLTPVVVGIPLFFGLIGSTRLLSLLEGRLIEAMSGVRMPRRLPFDGVKRAGPLKRASAYLWDWKTWATIAYLVLRLPLGVVYFVLAALAVCVPLGLIAGFWQPLTHHLFNVHSSVFAHDLSFVLWNFDVHAPMNILIAVGGIVLLVVSLNVIREVSRLHAKISKYMLVSVVH